MFRVLVTLMAVSVTCLGIAESAETDTSGGAAVKATASKSTSAEMSSEEYWRSHTHRRHAPGAPEASERRYYERRLRSELDEVFNYLPSRAQMDRAWTVMLLKQGLISKDTAVKLLTALVDADQQKGYGGEYWLRRKAGMDEDAASAVNLGRTLQEPMSRLMLRRKLMHVLELTLKSLEVTLDVADAHTETIMAGQTHLSHAQPTTYAAYLLSVHDGLARGLEQLELAYKHTNENSAGCGALAGTGWPVDRQMITELLGFDSLVEPTYDCEGGQDHPLTILFALTNITTLLSRTSMDHNIWSMEEIRMIKVPPRWCGVSSMMPQKAIPGSQLERIRIDACNVIGETITGVVACKGEPHGDMLPIYEGYRGALRALCHAERALGNYSSMLPAIEPDKERMLRLAREGFSATPDLAVKLIRDKGYGGRRAHRICATFVRIARERGIKPYETTGELLDEAARIADEEPPRLTAESHWPRPTSGTPNGRHASTRRPRSSPRKSPPSWAMHRRNELDIPVRSQQEQENGSRCSQTNHLLDTRLFLMEPFEHRRYWDHSRHDSFAQAVQERAEHHVAGPLEPLERLAVDPIRLACLASHHQRHRQWHRAIPVAFPSSVREGSPGVVQVRCSVRLRSRRQLAGIPEESWHRPTDHGVRPGQGLFVGSCMRPALPGLNGCPLHNFHGLFLAPVDEVHRRLHFSKCGVVVVVDLH